MDFLYIGQNLPRSAKKKKSLPGDIRTAGPYLGEVMSTTGMKAKAKTKRRSRQAGVMRSENKILRPFYNLIVAVSRRKKKGWGGLLPSLGLLSHYLLTVRLT